MSYFILIDPFRRWLNRAQTALVSKNKVRKELWTDFTEILLFEQPREGHIVVSKTNYTSLSSFLQTEGRSDTLKDDSILNWITTLHDLRQLLNEEIRFLRFHKVLPTEEEESKTIPTSPVAAVNQSSVSLPEQH